MDPKGTTDRLPNSSRYVMKAYERSWKHQAVFPAPIGFGRTALFAVFKVNNKWSAWAMKTAHDNCSKASALMFRSNARRASQCIGWQLPFLLLLRRSTCFLLLARHGLGLSPFLALSLSDRIVCLVALLPAFQESTAKGPSILGRSR